MTTKLHDFFAMFCMDIWDVFKRKAFHDGYMYRWKVVGVAMSDGWKATKRGN